MLRTLESARRGATTEEKRILARWSGWGSVPTVFLDEPDPDEPIYRPGGEWEGRFETDHARWESTTVAIPAMRQLGEALARPLPAAKDGRGARVSTAAARGKSTTRRGTKMPNGTAKKPGAVAEQAEHLRRDGAGPQQRNHKPTQR
ncbi:hypothetical protein ROS62_29415 [Streptomyces sp. DSM 41972]|uniref:Uncharacterized protein n=1 Tax=Streptomyces althioticus subsp. attaecolombicae TaxID=3075534 RepID=A0ABU3I728_9ACTN|nr:hypothetical protein [Streptomyces sp. DSM 41972]SCD36962.1 hypothetical protein GA0115238_10583 [Streptomyces sp. di50b]SCE52866.1 hypothetical protein GA0115245_14583 [Streptomyces sp. di188]